VTEYKNEVRIYFAMETYMRASGRMWTSLWRWEVLEFCINPQDIDARTVLIYRSTKYFNWFRL
jgi:hypothetical protein